MKKLLGVVCFFMGLFVVLSMNEPPVVQDDPETTYCPVDQAAELQELAVATPVLYADVGIFGAMDYKLNQAAIEVEGNWVAIETSDAFEPLPKEPFSHIDPGNQVKGRCNKRSLNHVAYCTGSPPIVPTVTG